MGRANTTLQEVRMRRDLVEEIIGDLHAPTAPVRYQRLCIEVDNRGTISLIGQSQMELGLDYERRLTVAEAALRLRKSPAHVRKLLRTGQLKGERTAKAWLIRENDVYAYMQTRTKRK